MPDAAHADNSHFDVAIIGGGPAGSTVATLLRKYNPQLSVLVLEKAKFPRDHIGESQLPAIGPILDEMGAWDKVERADFPVKLGASFTWGRDEDSWDFDFIPVEQFQDEPRPARFEGQRRHTAFQVDRAIYDEILLGHAEEMGARVMQETAVAEITCEGDKITGLVLDSGATVSATHYVDATGVVGLLRNTLGLASHAPTQLRNIAIWDYWENAEWAVKIGVGGTRIQVRSLPYGWLWFIPLGPTRTSLGLICPAEYYKNSGMTPEELYKKSIESNDQIAALVKDAAQRGNVETTKDWSHLTERLAGENWFICGEAAGFADPILSAGMTLAHTSARHVAYSILELERGEIDRPWLIAQYDERNRKSIGQHIRFAQYWYASNGCFTELKDHCAEIAKEDGLRLRPEDAWAWLARGGFSTQQAGRVDAGSFDIFSAKKIVGMFQGTTEYRFQKYNKFKLNLLGAKKGYLGELRDGRIDRIECYRRGEKTLSRAGCYDGIIKALKLTHDGTTLLNTLGRSIEAQVPPAQRNQSLSEHMQALEAMLIDGWITATLDKRRPCIRISDDGSRAIRSTAEGMKALEERDSE